MSVAALVILVLLALGGVGVGIAALLGSQAQLRWRREVKEELGELRDQLLQAQERVGRLEADRDFYERLLGEGERKQDDHDRG